MLVPGFDPRAIGGEMRRIGRAATTTYSGVRTQACARILALTSWGGNINYGNTAGSLCHRTGGTGTARSGIPMTYCNDWFQGSKPTPRSRHQRRRTLEYRPLGFSTAIRSPSPSPNWSSRACPSSTTRASTGKRTGARRNWIQAPPFYFGSGMYMSEDDTIAHTQRLDCPYVVILRPDDRWRRCPRWSARSGTRPSLDRASSPFEKVTSVPVLELPTAPVGSLAGFSNMRINPGWPKRRQHEPAP